MHFFRARGSSRERVCEPRTDVPADFMASNTNQSGWALGGSSGEGMPMAEIVRNAVGLSVAVELMTHRGFPT